MLELNHLFQKEFITEQQKLSIETYESKKLFSIHWELRLLLYIGIMLLIAGLGILIYKNIDVIGHTVIIGVIVILLSTIFYYNIKNKKNYSNKKIKNESPFYDYAVLFSALLVAVFLGYLQFQYQLFGIRYGIATLIPAIIYFLMAYVFDHKGVLSLGITGFASAMGLSVTPLQLLEINNFSSLQICYTAIAVGVLYECVSYASEIKIIKTHFCFTYSAFAINLIFISLLSLLFLHDFKPLTTLIILGVGTHYFYKAKIQSSYLFLLLSVLYCYVGFTYLLFFYLTKFESLSEIIAYFSSLYFIGSCLGIVLFFINFKKILKIKNDSI